MNENVTVCITPKGEKPVLHFSQFDNERVFTVTVLADDGESAAVLTGLDIEFRLRKTDSHVVTIAPESVSDNVITFKTTEQMCACCGQNIASVNLMKDDMNIATLDILVNIQRDILSGGLTSVSDIHNLNTQIEHIVPEVIGDDYYNKQEVDDLLAEHTFDPSNYYNKLDVDSLLADKADANDVYTISELDTLLDEKMDTIGYHGIVDDAAVISFTTDCNAPLDIIKGKITPVQSGSGTPSPQNVRPISGFSALNVTRTGVNLWNEEWEQGSIDSITGLNELSSLHWRTNYIKISPTTRYYIVSATAENKSLRARFYDENKNYIGYSPKSGGTYTDSSFVSPDNAYYVRFAPFASDIPNHDLSLNYPSTDTEYHAYNGQTASVNFGQTVYGGVADVTNGKLTITHVIKNIGANDISDNGTSGGLIELYVNGTSNKKNGQTNMLCNNLEVRANASAYAIRGRAGSSNVTFCLPTSDVPDFNSAKTWVTNNPIELVYELATPIEITTTPETVLSIAGDNNIFLDTGNLTEIAYFEGAEYNLIKLIKACQI